MGEEGREGGRVRGMEGKGGFAGRKRGMKQKCSGSCGETKKKQ